MKATTSRDRFDESSRFTGVYQQMGRVALDSDWNEEVRIRTVDGRRRTQDLAHGSPDDGFRISDAQVVDDIDGVAGWHGALLTPPDIRVIPPVLELDRREPAGLPHVIKASGRVELLRTMQPLDLEALPLRPDGTFAATHLVVRLRFDRPENDQDLVNPVLRFVDADGIVVDLDVIGSPLPRAWTAYRIPVGDLGALDRTRLRTWGIVGLPRRATVWVDALTAVDATRRHDDLVIRGGDGTLAGAGRMLVHGRRAWLRHDVRYTRQPDVPEPPALSPLASDGTEKHLVYLDVWERTVVADQDHRLVEPALSGLDTTFRRQLVRQVRVLQNLDADAPETLPTPTGSLKLTTDVPEGAFPDRYPQGTLDPCRDRCLSSQERSLGVGYTGGRNLHVRVEVVHPDGLRPVIAWSRDNGATRLPLAETAQPGDRILRLTPSDAALLRSGDVIVIGDDVTDLQPEGAKPPTLRVVRGSDPATGLVHLEDDDFVLTTDPSPLAAGGPLAHRYPVESNGYVRRWDGADWLVTGVRYNLADGITFRFHGGEARRAEYWSFITRLVAPDGETRGYIEKLDAADVHGPVHHRIAISRVTRQADALAFDDLRPRFLPLVEVRDRLQELAERSQHNAFTIVVGDGVHTFGDIDQDLVAGVTADEAIQRAVDRLHRWMREVGESEEASPSHDGGTIYIRAGFYHLLHPVILAGHSRIRILGDGDASELRVVGAGGAFVIDRCGARGEVGIEQLLLVEDPDADNVIGTDVGSADAEEPDGVPLHLDDLAAGVTGSPSFLAKAASVMKKPDVDAHRAMAAIRTTLARLRFLQSRDPGVDMETHPEGSGLLAVLRALPHGVVTIADSRRVHVEGVTIRSVERRRTAVGVLLTGTCHDIRVSRCELSANTGLAATPLGPFLTKKTLARHPWSGLWIDGLLVEDCTVSGHGEGLHGIRLAGGFFADVQVRHNRIEGTQTGIELRAQRWLGLTDDRLLRIEDNRVVGTNGLGIDVDASHVRIEGNDVRPRATRALVQLGIRLTGRRGTIEGCKVVLPPGTAAPLALQAAICVGSGFDDGMAGRLAAEDIEVRRCHVAASGPQSSVGVVLGGREPVYDVRVRDCTFTDLGDAAVRTWGHGAPVGRIRIEDNRVEGVARTAPPARADVADALSAYAPKTTEALLAANVSTRDPAALLGALVSHGPAAIPALDAVLRWVAQHSLRGGVVLDHTLGAEVRGNRVQTVGDRVHRPNSHTAGIAIVGGADVTVTDNHVEDVRAGRVQHAPPAEPVTPTRPAAFGVLQGLALQIGEERLERSDLHLAAVRLRHMVLAYIAGDQSERQEVGRRIYAPMDALAEELDTYAGQGSQIASQLVLEADEMRASQGYDAHTEAAQRVLASTSRAAGFTAEGEDAQDAWDAATTLDLSVVSGPDATKAEAARLQDGLDVLARGHAALRKRLFEQLAELIGAPADRMLHVTAARGLGQLGAVRDAEADAPTARPGIYGTRRTVVVRFAETLATEAARLQDEPADARGAMLGALRPDKDALVNTLRETNPELARDVEADWRVLDRAVTPPSEAKLDRLRQTLGQVQGWAEGASVPPATDHRLERRSEAGEAALAGVVARHIDRNLEGLNVEPEGTRTKSLKLLHRTSLQLTALVSDDADLEPLARSAREAIGKAADDNASRGVRLAEARTALDRLRRAAEVVVPRLPPVEAAPKSDVLDQRLAALAAITLALPSLDLDGRDDGVTLLLGHVDPVLDAARMDGRPRSTTLRALEQAGAVLRRPQQGSDAPQAVHSIVRELDRAGNAAVHADSPTRLKTVAALVHAAQLAVDPAIDVDTRLARTQGALREREAVLAGSWARLLIGISELADLTAAIADALDRLARGERPSAPTLPTPTFPMTLDPADALLALSPRARLQLGDNVVRTAHHGITVRDGGAHPLAEPEISEGVVASVVGNRIDGCLLGAVNVSLRRNANVTVGENEAFACSGVGEPGRPGIGQGVVSLTGRGDLVVRDNTLRGNGHDVLHAVLHEILVDWRGDASIAGNTVRHLGGEGGGAGVLVVAERSRSGLPLELARASFLGIEPPPRRRTVLPQIPTPFGVQPATLIANGRLSQSVAKARLAPRALSTLRKPHATSPALAHATRVFEPRVKPLAGLLELVRPLLFPLPSPPPPEHLTTHIQGNDVTSVGPALLVVSEPDRDVVSVSVVGNALSSLGTTGAVYVRYPDSLVLGHNRCEAARVVNVVLVRCRDATVASTGNVVLGAEPVTPPAPPTVPSPPKLLGPLLKLPLGELSIDIPLSQHHLLGSLEVFTGAAQQAFSDILVERALAEPEPTLPPLELIEEGVPTPASGAVATTARLSTGMRISGAGSERLEAGRLLAESRAPYVLELFEGPTDPTAVLDAFTTREDLTSDDITAAVRGTTLTTFENDADRERFVLAVDNLRKSRKIAEIEHATAVDRGVERQAAAGVFSRVRDTGQTQEGALAGMTRLLAAQGYRSERVAAETRALLEESSGDARAALGKLERDLFATEEASAPARAAIEHATLLERLIAEGVIGGSTAVDPSPALEAIPPLPPDPFAHSLVVIGGAAVTSVGNATTAGALVLGAHESVTLDI